ncbi:MAG: hypothetical protein HOV81_11520 [Kofleriaceae bacterium]|nr:hypothetical protein [Kofleriaceae bacterium]
MVSTQRAQTLDVLHAALPTLAELDALAGLSPDDRAALPVVDGRLAAPFALDWQGDEVHSLRFEVYAESSPLSAIGARLYRLVLDQPACRHIQVLEIDEVACTSDEAVSLLGDPIWLLAREGLPAMTRRLSLTRSGLVAHGGDLGYLPLGDLSPLAGRLGAVEHLHLTGVERLGALALPRLHTLRLTSSVSTANLRELARLELPALAHLELSCDLFADPELRFAGMRALLRSKGLPSLRRLVLDELDVDDDQHAELDEDGDDPPSWVEMIARSPLLRQLESLSLTFSAEEREAPMLVELADAFSHLRELEITDAAGDRVTLVAPTAAAIASALE